MGVKMKAFVAIISALIAAASAKSDANIVAPAYAYGAYGYPYAGAYGAYGYGLAAAPAAVAAAPVAAATYAAAPVAYAAAPAAYINPYDYAGQVYPAAEPYVHEEIEAEPYVEEIAAEPYVHEEIAAEPY